MPPRDTNGMSMDHRQAQATNASERYLLGEMTEPERFDFESHYFECEECAVDVRTVHAFAEGVKAVCSEEPVPVRVHTAPAPAGPPRMWWLRWWVPAFAAGCALIAVWQGLIVIPGLRSQMESRAMTAIPLRAAARGSEQSIELRGDQPYQLVSLDVNNVDAETPIAYQLVDSGGEVRVSRRATSPPLGSPLIVTLWRKDLERPGSWTLILRDQKGTEISRYPFSVPK
jgi:hypothetical protein